MVPMGGSGTRAATAHDLSVWHTSDTGAIAQRRCAQSSAKPSRRGITKGMQLIPIMQLTPFSALTVRLAGEADIAVADIDTADVMAGSAPAGDDR